MPIKRLTKKQEKFADEFATKDITVEGAALIAGYSYSSARTDAHNFLSNPSIQARIEERKAECAKIANVTKAQIIGATVLRAFATIDDVLDESGNFDIEKARETGAIHLVKKISKKHTQFGVNTDVEFYSNESAQDKLANYLGLEKAPQEDKTEIIRIALELYRAKINQGLAQDIVINAVLALVADKTTVRLTARELLAANSEESGEENIIEGEIVE